MTIMLPNTEKYLIKTVRSWLGLPDSSQYPINHFPKRLADLLLRVEEHKNPHRDQWGAWEHAYSSNYRNGKLWVPEIDHWVASERKKLTEQGNTLIPMWPNGKKFAICLTHDVDLIGNTLNAKQFLRSLKLFYQSNDLTDIKQKAKKFLLSLRDFSKICGDASQTKDSLEYCYRVEKEFDVKASYFFTTYPLDKYSKYDCLYTFSDNCTFLNKKMTVAELLQFLKKEGHDIGLHGSYYSALDKDLLYSQKKTIENALGDSVTTTRQHWLHWEIKKTPRIQSDCSFHCDSTMGFNRNIGYRAGTGLPFYFFDYEKQEELPLLQLPLIIQENPLYLSNALEYDESLAKEAVTQILDQVKETQSCATVLWHPNNFNLPFNRNLYRWIIQYAVDNGAWVTSVKEIAEWWKQRKLTLSPPFLEQENKI